MLAESWRYEIRQLFSGHRWGGPPGRFLSG